ncbi:MAG: NTP transferase domain-containing protein [Pseudomonadota bacterium]
MSALRPQIVIPMSGFGERFRRAGHTLPKPLIPVDGKPIIAHVIDMFPDTEDFIFICNEDHLSHPDYRMAETLRRYCPTGKIIGIGAHKLGPTNAVLQAAEHIDPTRPVIINYCDFTCYWDYSEFLSFVTETECDGAIPAYRGFHPHSIGSTFYAYVKETGLWMDDIQEKQPWTDTPMNEYASSGTYYFKSGELCLSALRAQMALDYSVNGEYYVSLAYKVLQDAGARTAVYELQHFMQWGTPADLEEYLGWSACFRRLLLDSGTRAQQTGAVMVPMAGLGSRFSKAGYATPKPLIQVSGRPMVIQAARDLPDAPVTRFVLRKDLPSLVEIQRKLRTSFVEASPHILDGLTEGQAITCLEGLEGLSLDKPLTIGACDNGMLYDTSTFEALMTGDGPDVIVWTIRGHADGQRRPEQFGWCETDEDGRIIGMRVKAAPDDPKTAPMVTGTFTFRRAGDFARCTQRLVERNGRVNNEFYVDSLVEDAIALGLDVRVFDIDHYIGWGTPDDLMTFQYWQSCFHKWKSHPYSIPKDKRVPHASLERLLKSAAHIPPRLPDGVRPAAAPRKRRESFTAKPFMNRFLKRA